MSEEIKPATEQEPEPISVAEFLESTPPNTWRHVSGLTKRHSVSSDLLAFNDAQIRLFCGSSVCNGYRFFESTLVTPISLEAGESYRTYVEYYCRNCQETTKVYSLCIATAKDGKNGRMYKFGESPEFGPPTPSRVISLIGPDREIFLKGRRSENRGLGIGAFSYYRRVVENQKNRIIDEIIKVSQKLGADQALVDDLKAAKNETQFSKAIETIKHGIPQVLLIDGHNPLALLHSALSQGLHDQSDDECLELATSIRIVLTELADRMGQALKDEAELKGAVSKLLEIKTKKGD